MDVRTPTNQATTRRLSRSKRERSLVRVRGRSGPGCRKRLAWISAEGEPEPANLDAVHNCLFQLVTGDYFRTLDCS